jgi:hypothetical protein
VRRTETGEDTAGLWMLAKRWDMFGLAAATMSVGERQRELLGIKMR